MMNLIDLRGDLLSVSRPAKGEWVRGIWKDGERKIFSVKALVEPIDANEVIQAEEGRRSVDQKRIYTNKALVRSDDAKGVTGDLLVIDGETYEVFEVEKWSDVGVVDTTYYVSKASKLEADLEEPQPET